MLENFGFNVIEPRCVTLPISMIFTSASAAGRLLTPLFARKDVIETALTQVIDGKAENDAFNQLITIAGLEPQAVVWLRAWHRYLRQTGLNYGVPTIVAALGNNAGIARAIVSLFTALHDPVFAGDRAAVAVKLDEEIKAGLAKVAAADEDRILRLMQAVVKATLRTQRLRSRVRKRRWPSSSTARKCRACPHRCPGGRCSSILPALRVFTCAPGRSPAAGCAGPTGATISHRNPRPDEGTA